MTEMSSKLIGTSRRIGQHIAAGGANPGRSGVTNVHSPLEYLTAAVVSVERGGTATLSFQDNIGNAAVVTNVPGIPSSVAIFPGDTVLVAKAGGTRWVVERLGQDYAIRFVGQLLGFQNGWADGSVASPAYSQLRYWMDAGSIMHMDGIIAGGTVGLPAFTLSGQFPLFAQVVACPTGNNAEIFGSVEIRANGDFVPLNGSNLAFYLSGVTWPAGI